MYAALLILPLALLALGFPIVLILMICSILVVTVFTSLPDVVLHQVITDTLSKYALQAVPFFIFAGDLMSKGGISRRILRWVESVIGSIPGSLPFTSLGFSAIFGAISGATTAGVAAVGTMTYPRMREAGYSERFAAALVTAEGALDNLIPPSIAFIIYGIATETSVVLLFAAGILPGIVLALFYGAYIYFVTRKEGVVIAEKFNVLEFLRASRDGVWALGAIVIILGGIYSGIFTPTEAAGVVCVYAILVTWLVYREATLRDIFNAASRTAYLTTLVFLIVAVAGMFGWLLTVSGISNTVSQFVSNLPLPGWGILLCINVILLIAGCFLDPGTALLVLIPLLLPIAASLGINPIHFGVIVVMNLTIGSFTPPFGVNIFVVQALFKPNTMELYAGLVPFIILAIAALMVVTYVPFLSLWIPSFIL